MIKYKGVLHLRDFLVMWKLTRPIYQILVVLFESIVNSIELLVVIDRATPLYHFTIVLLLLLLLVGIIKSTINYLWVMLRLR